MTVQQLIIMLVKLPNLSAPVVASDIYNEGTFTISGMIYNEDGVELTGEEK